MNIIFDKDAAERLGGEYNIRQAVHVLRITTREQCFGWMILNGKACALGAIFEVLPQLVAATAVGINPRHKDLPPGMNRPFCYVTGYLKTTSKTPASIVTLNDRFRLSFEQIANVLEAVAEGHELYEIESPF